MKLPGIHVIALLLSGLMLTGCGVVAAGTAGAIAADEGIVEDDGTFDPFENTAAGEEIYN